MAKKNAEKKKAGAKRRGSTGEVKCGKCGQPFRYRAAMKKHEAKCDGKAAAKPRGASSGNAGGKPVLSAGTVVEAGDVFLIEQPEIRINPDAPLSDLYALQDRITEVIRERVTA